MISLVPDENIIYLDESGFNLHVNPIYGWALQGENAYLTTPNNRGRNVSLMATICSSGLISYELMQGSYNADHLVQYLENGLYQRIPERLMSGNCVIVMDNARFHHSAAVKQWCRDHNIRLEYLPPYSPQLNPIEEVFSMVKSRYRNVRPRPETLDEMYESLERILNELTGYDYMPFYARMREFVTLGLTRSPFI